MKEGINRQPPVNREESWLGFSSYARELRSSHSRRRARILYGGVKKGDYRNTNVRATARSRVEEMWSSKANPKIVGVEREQTTDAGPVKMTAVTSRGSCKTKKQWRKGGSARNLIYANYQ